MEQLPGVVNVPARTYRPSRWARAFVLLLVAAIGLQGAPLQPLVHSLQHAPAPHEAAHHGCEHPQGVCPMNPNGPCRCDHDDAETPSTDGPVFEGCNSPTSSALQTTARLLWLSDPDLQIPGRRSHLVSLVPHRSLLSSQRTGDDVFHPPRVEATPQPASTPQAPVSA